MGMSQDEIDGLRAEMESGRGAPDTTQPDGDTLERSKQIFLRMVSLYTVAIRNIVPILVGAEQVSSTAELALTGSLEDIVSGRKDNSLFFTVKEPQLTDAYLTGWIDNQFALNISKRMMGQEEETAFNEGLLSALNEAFSNIFGAFDTSLKDEFKQPVEHSDFKLIEGDIISSIQKETAMEASVQICVVPVSVKISDLSGGMGLLVNMDGLEQIYSKHPSTKQEALSMAASKRAETEAGAAGASKRGGESVSKATVPFESRKAAPEIPLARFEDLTPHRATGEARGVELIFDVPLSVSVELGRKRLSVKEILDLVPGSLVELDKLAGENVDLFVNGKLFAKGEVVVVDENFGIRVASIVTPKERLERLK